MERTEILPSLDELAETINREHEFVEQSFSAGVAHAVTCGEQLLAARSLVPKGNWCKWCEENLSFSLASAGVYIRLASFSEIAKAAPSISAGVKMLAAAGKFLESDLERKFDTEDAQMLLDAGWSYTNIGKALGVSRNSVIMRLDPEQRARHNELSKARKKRKRVERDALRRQTIAEAASKAGGGIDRTFKAIRAAQREANNLSETGDTPETRQAATLAYRAMGRAEDEIAKILVTS